MPADEDERQTFSIGDGWSVHQSADRSNSVMDLHRTGSAFGPWETI
jgi:hypothetical protein